MTITGKVVYQNIGMGCWGIIANNGTEYRPVNMPEQLKTKGAKATKVVSTVPVTGTIKDFTALRAASLGFCPLSKLSLYFSATMMASSTSIPTTKIMPIIDKRSMFKPKA